MHSPFTQHYTITQVEAWPSVNFNFMGCHKYSVQSLTEEILMFHVDLENMQPLGCPVLPLVKAIVNIPLGSCLQSVNHYYKHSHSTV